MPVDNQNMCKKVLKICIYLLAVIGFIFLASFLAFKLGWTKNSGIIDYFQKSRMLRDNKTYAWIETAEWKSLKETMKNEKIVLAQVEKDTGIKSRLLASILFVEQMRLYNSNTELFKKVFEPLKLLGVQSQFSWGILGIKQETAIQIENNLKNPTSSYYLGKDFENILSFSTAKPDEERFNRITNEHNHYYTYLYAGLFIRQIERQWKNAGYDISNRPEILSTIYNIGFEHSRPNDSPKIGGAEIEINGEKYSFGGLANEFYNSNELVDIFPR